MKLYSINTGYFKLDGGAMFGVVPKSIWNKINPADENNLCSWALRCLLIEDGNRLILVDNGNGNKQAATSLVSEPSSAVLSALVNYCQRYRRQRADRSRRKDKRNVRDST